MSLYAMLNGHEVDNYGKGLREGETLHDTFLCPSCSAPMHHVAKASNKRIPHFAGHHLLGCDIGHTNPSEGNLVGIDMTGFTAENLLSSICKQEAPSSNNRDRSSTVLSMAGASKTNRITTIRKLFHVCASNPPGAILYDNVTIKDLYCGDKTKFLYTKYITGLHLVYAQYKSFDEDSLCFNFCYPDNAAKTLWVNVTASSRDVFSQIRKNLGHVAEHRFAAILAIFDYQRCTVTVAKQVVPL